MVKTTEIYYEDAYIDEFDAIVTSCAEGDKGNFFVCLDRTCFFPEQGGQTPDIGEIVDEQGTAHKVQHVSISDGMITHVIDTAIPEGTKIHGKIDWAHRFSNMQQHTGEHIFSGVVHSEFGFDNVGFHLSDSEVTMDYNGVLSSEDIKRVENIVNEAIWKNVAVRCEFPDPAQLENLDYRSKKELTGDVRIVTVEGYDVCACCAPHVNRTGEIGILKVVKCQNYKGGVRVNILCGKRALDYINTDQQIAEELTALLTTGRDRIVDSVRRMGDEIYALKGQLSCMREKVLSYELKEIDPELKDVFLVKEAGLDQGVIRNTVNALTGQHGGYCAVFSGSDDEGYKYVLASGSDGRDARLIQNLLKDEFQARGGGSPAMVQGSLPAGTKISDVLIKCQGFEA